MARHLLQAEADRTAGVVLLLLVVAAAAAVASVVVALCTSSNNAKPWKQRRGSSPLAPQLEEQGEGGAGAGVGKKQLLASLSGIGGKAAAVAKMASWNRRSSLTPPGADWSSSGRASDDGDDQQQVATEEALWKKTIIMGEKCRPLEFSGRIDYDSDGNLLPPPTPPAATAAESMKNDSATADAGDH